MWATHHIQTLKPDLVVAASTFRYPRNFHKQLVMDPEWNRGLAASVRRLHRGGARVVVLGDIPYLGASPPGCLAAHMSDVQACSAPLSKAVPLQHDERERAAVEQAGVRYVNTVPWFCGDQTCAAAVGDLSVYRNDSHVSATYARWLSGVMRAALRLDGNQ
jgi:hypothetical protein